MVEPLSLVVSGGIAAVLAGGCAHPSLPSESAPRKVVPVQHSRVRGGLHQRDLVPLQLVVDLVWGEAELCLEEGLQGHWVWRCQLLERCFQKGCEEGLHLGRSGIGRGGEEWARESEGCFWSA